MVVVVVVVMVLVVVLVLVLVVMAVPRWRVVGVEEGSVMVEVVGVEVRVMVLV